ncbi:MAG TPA: hypothetical protein VK136_08825 [Bacillota bacterium]|nr:hypothetical protein [Bacillota bacterium]
MKLDPKNGDILNDYTEDVIPIFHTRYTGPEYRIQCGVCGLVEEEQTFIKFAKFE